LEVEDGAILDEVLVRELARPHDEILAADNELAQA